jgi:5-methylcytosine-specific restriction enzyme subunit McrC
VSGSIIRPTIRLREWQTALRPDLALRAEDRPLVAQLAGGGAGRLAIDELRAGLRIGARSWVGVVRFADFDLVVEPKLAGEQVGLVELLAFTTGLAALRRLAGGRTIEIAAGGLDLFDLLALLFAEACDRTLRGGILADYMTREGSLLALHGRLLADRQLTRHFGRVDRLACRYDERTTDIPENIILAAALEQCAGRVADEDVRLRVRRLVTVLGEVCDPAGADLRRIRETLVYTRLNAHYREAHELAWFILDGLGIPDLLRLGATRGFAFLLDMNALFERFIWKVLESLAPPRGLRVRYQRQDRSILWNASADRPYGSVIPDLLLDRPGSTGALAIDAKYKTYDAKKLSNDDLYQTFLYAFAYGPRTDASPPQALLLYPAAGPVPAETVVAIRDRTARTLGSIHALGLHIPSLLREIRDAVPGPLTRLLLDRIAATMTAPLAASADVTSA